MSEPAFRIIDICNDAGHIVEPSLLTKAESVHRQLRQRLPQNYVECMRRVFGFGARMAVATENDNVVGLVVWRCYEDTHDGIKFYVDDLVTDEAHRSRGVGRTLTTYMQDRAKQAGAINLVLDSGIQRHLSHKFYFREGFSIIAYNLKKSLA
ncbi:MAG TPA: GNAT family N-acetyltransferase [Rhodocyclaceae bacterium]|nr:GNAT family N-acetyltransferase [Rhodocyclaceae bacterium]